mmetsp:Transcript_61112/g.170601  ORF Transcript_61112/g.170601 Transcript_61112/m.170601 type:complete len:269 (-) Transcript_61112:466-1272(-)
MLLWAAALEAGRSSSSSSADPCLRASVLARGRARVLARVRSRQAPVAGHRHRRRVWAARTPPGHVLLLVAVGARQAVLQRGRRPLAGERLGRAGRPRRDGHRGQRRLPDEPGPADSPRGGDRGRRRGAGGVRHRRLARPPRRGPRGGGGGLLRGRRTAVQGRAERPVRDLQRARAGAGLGPSDQALPREDGRRDPRPQRQPHHHGLALLVPVRGRGGRGPSRRRQPGLLPPLLRGQRGPPRESAHPRQNGDSTRGGSVRHRVGRVQPR